MVRIRFFSLIRRELGISEVSLDLTSGSLRQYLQKAEEKICKEFVQLLFNDDLKVRKGTIILINGRNIVHLKGIDSKIRTGDEISIFPPGGGG